MIIPRSWYLKNRFYFHETDESKLLEFINSMDFDWNLAIVIPLNLNNF
jgi:hypothetical protein